MFGTKIADVSSVNEYVENVHKLGLFYVRRLTQPLYLFNFIYMITPYFLKEKFLIRDLHKFTEKVIRKRKAIINETVSNGKQHKIMLDILLDEVNKGNIDEKTLRDEVNTFLFEVIKFF